VFEYISKLLSNELYPKENKSVAYILENSEKITLNLSNNLFSVHVYNTTHSLFIEHVHKIRKHCIRAHMEVFDKSNNPYT
jgi:hypothetical protein